MKSLYVFVLFLFFFDYNLCANVKLPAVFGDNMVLQRGPTVPVYGWAEPGERISVKGSWQFLAAQTKANKEGKWRVDIELPKAKGPFSLIIKGSNVIIFKNVLVGEVWLASGQSNMEWNVLRAANAQEEIKNADYPEIRLFTVEQQYSDNIKEDVIGQWVECSSGTVPNFSAVAYFFGRQIHKELDVPVGLIDSSWGGTPVHAWMSIDCLEAQFPNIVNAWKKSQENLEDKKIEYEKSLSIWEKESNELESKNLPSSRKPEMPYCLWRNRHPARLYNAMIAPLIPFKIKGVIWYQGEADASWAWLYRRTFPAMILDWRKNWNQGDFPFLYVQLPNFKKIQDEPNESEWAELRESQLMALKINNTGMVTAIDLGEANSVHPQNKQDVGKRLCLVGLAKAYGKGVEFSGPIFKKMRIENDKIRILFDYAEGLFSKNGCLKGFAISGPDGKFIWADATIDNNSVLVYNDFIPNPIAVRYAWADNPEGCNLYNKAGLPASPFRTDDWIVITTGRY